MSSTTTAETLAELSARARACTVCSAHLPLGPRPVFTARPTARVLILGHAPGTRVHASGVPWDDPSGDTLRQWMALDREAFYQHPLLAIIPTGLCYPGKGRGGDLPPRPECAPLWQPQFRAHMPQLKLVLAIGAHAQAYELGAARRRTLGDTVQAYRDYLADGVFPLPHPSPRNRKWLRDRPWFEEEVVPALRQSLRRHGVGPS